MREFCDDREKLRKKGRNLKQIDAQISALQKNIDKLKKEGEDWVLLSPYIIASWTCRAMRARAQSGN